MRVRARMFARAGTPPGARPQASDRRRARHTPPPPQEGFFAFYRGWLPSVIGVVPYVGLNFGVYETLKASLLAHYGLRDERELSVSGRVGTGGRSGSETSSGRWGEVRAGVVGEGASGAGRGALRAAAEVLRGMGGWGSETGGGRLGQ